MKASKVILGLYILLCVTASATYAQQQFTQTVTTQNKNCNFCSRWRIFIGYGYPALIIGDWPIKQETL
jgi:hypothetical protein